MKNLIFAKYQILVENLPRMLIGGGTPPAQFFKKLGF
jgi:hypothetical protein